MPKIKCLLVDDHTLFRQGVRRLQSLEAGASGYVLKDTPSPRLLSAVRDLSKGGKYVTSWVLGNIGNHSARHTISRVMRARSWQRRIFAGIACAPLWTKVSHHTPILKSRSDIYDIQLFQHQHLFRSLID